MGKGITAEFTIRWTVITLWLSKQLSIQMSPLRLRVIRLEGTKPDACVPPGDKMTRVSPPETSNDNDDSQSATSPWNRLSDDLKQLQYFHSKNVNTPIFTFNTICKLNVETIEKNLTHMNLLRGKCHHEMWCNSTKLEVQIKAFVH